MHELGLGRRGVFVAWVWLACGCALAQGDKPGPMQSGDHASKQIESKSDKPAAEPTKTASQDFDVAKLFAGSCGWCHHNGGRDAGKGPKLMDSPLTDAEIVFRIKKGKQGFMPAFESAFNEDQMKAIVAYIRGLKPQP